MNQHKKLGIKRNNYQKWQKVKHRGQRENIQVQLAPYCVVHDGIINGAFHRLHLNTVLWMLHFVHSVVVNVSVRRKEGIKEVGEADLQVSYIRIMGTKNTEPINKQGWKTEVSRISSSLRKSGEIAANYPGKFLWYGAPRSVSSSSYFHKDILASCLSDNGHMGATLTGRIRPPLKVSRPKWLEGDWRNSESLVSPSFGVARKAKMKLV